MSSSGQMAKSRETLTPGPIDRAVRIGHVHLKVADLERALKFYCGVLGFELTQRRSGAAFVSAGGYRHVGRPGTGWVIQCLRRPTSGGSFFMVMSG